mgnify:CR=1 FL=1
MYEYQEAVVTLPYSGTSHCQTLSMFRKAPMPELSGNLGLFNGLKHTWTKEEVIEWLKAHSSRQIEYVQKSDWNDKI